MELLEFVGVWKDEFGNILEIKPKDRNSLRVNFISGKTGKPVQREFYQNKESINMDAELDFYKSSLNVELWKKGKGFHLSLLYDWIVFRNESGFFLAPSITEYMESDLYEKFGHLFMPFGYYRKIENLPITNAIANAGLRVR